MIDEYEVFSGMRFGMENRSTRNKTTPVPFCSQIQHDLGSNSGRRSGKPAANYLSYGTAYPTLNAACP
jgi:hypothetical protein